MRVVGGESVLPGGRWMGCDYVNLGCWRLGTEVGGCGEEGEGGEERSSCCYGELRGLRRRCPGVGRWVAVFTWS